jgi:predicted RNA binding protein YcfA (HicA-like mRNA interferase family)
MKVRDVMRRLLKDGWYLKNQEGSHRQYKHPTKKGKVTLPGHPNDDLNPRTWKSIQEQAGWLKEESP